MNAKLVCLTFRAGNKRVPPDSQSLRRCIGRISWVKIEITAYGNDGRKANRIITWLTNRHRIIQDQGRSMFVSQLELAKELQVLEQVQQVLGLGQQVLVQVRSRLLVWCNSLYLNRSQTSRIGVGSDLPCYADGRSNHLCNHHQCHSHLYYL